MRKPHQLTELNKKNANAIKSLEWTRSQCQLSVLLKPVLPLGAHLFNMKQTQLGLVLPTLVMTQLNYLQQI